MASHSWMQFCLIIAFIIFAKCVIIGVGFPVETFVSLHSLYQLVIPNVKSKLLLASGFFTPLGPDCSKANQIIQIFIHTILISLFTDKGKGRKN